jgi:hypothetical protein
VRLRPHVVEADLVGDRERRSPQPERLRITGENSIAGDAAQHARLRRRRRCVCHDLDGAIEARERGLVLPPLPEDLAEIHLGVGRRRVVSERNEPLGGLG